MSNDMLIRDLRAAAPARGFQPACVRFDRGYASRDNRKRVGELGWTFWTPLKANRLVNQDGTKNCPLEQGPIAAAGTVVHLQGFGKVVVFRVVPGAVEVSGGQLPRVSP